MINSMESVINCAKSVITSFESVINCFKSVITPPKSVISHRRVLMVYTIEKDTPNNGLCVISTIYARYSGVMRHFEILWTSTTLYA